MLKKAKKFKKMKKEKKVRIKVSLPKKTKTKVKTVKKLKKVKKPKLRLRVFSLTTYTRPYRYIAVTRERSGPDHLLKLKKRPEKERSFFIQDKRTNTFRLAAAPHLAMSN